jgi:hypothetical protein
MHSAPSEPEFVIPVFISLVGGSVTRPAARAQQSAKLPAIGFPKSGMASTPVICLVAVFLIAHLTRAKHDFSPPGLGG